MDTLPSTSHSFYILPLPPLRSLVLCDSETGWLISISLLSRKAEDSRDPPRREKRKWKRRKYLKLCASKYPKRSLFAVDIHNLVRYYMRCHLARLSRTVWVKWAFTLEHKRGWQRVATPFSGCSNFELKIRRTNLMWKQPKQIAYMRSVAFLPIPFEGANVWTFLNIFWVFFIRAR